VPQPASAITFDGEDQAGRSRPSQHQFCPEVADAGLTSWRNGPTRHRRSRVVHAEREFDITNEKRRSAERERFRSSVHLRRGTHFLTIP
jgi:hypothetical protein